MISNLRSAEEKCQSLEDDIRLQQLSKNELTQTNAELEVCVVQNKRDTAASFLGLCAKDWVFVIANFIYCAISIMFRNGCYFNSN